MHTVYENTGQRVAVLVDVQNMFYSARAIHQSKIEYRKLLQVTTQGRQLVRAVAYVVQKPDVDQSGFIEALRRSGFEVRRKELTIREDGSTKGDWKVEIALDASALAPKVDCIVLATGDGDFVPLVAAMKARGCWTEVVSFEQSTSGELKRACDAFIPIGDEVMFKEEKFVRYAQERKPPEPAGEPEAASQQAEPYGADG